MENKRSKVLISILLVVLCLSVCAGLTYAYFTDSAKSSGNKIQAGNLKLDLKLYDKVDGWQSIKNSEDPVFNYEKWEPGYVDAKLLKIENLGDLAMQWEAKLVSTEAVSAFANAIEVYVQKSDTEFAYPADRAAALAWTKVGTLDQFINTAEKLASGTFTVQGEAYYIGIAFYMPAEITDNTLQGQVLGAFDIQINATQLAYESDAFDENYDPDATFPNGGVTPPEETEETTSSTSTEEPTETETEPNENEPTETEPTETEPTETEPTETETEPNENEPTETETAPNENEPTETEPTETEPIEPTDPSIFTWKLNDDGASYTVTGLVNPGTVEDLVIPSTYMGLPVTAIGTFAFSSDQTITRVTFPDTLTTIGVCAFRFCYGFTEIVIPDSVIIIDEQAFSVCSGLTKLTIGNGVTSIGKMAFWSCHGLTEIVIPDSVTTIETTAFGGCTGLTEIIIPDSVTTIGHSAFTSCENLRIYCSAESAPDNWDDAWNCCDDSYDHSGDHSAFCMVIWGWTGEEYTYTFETNGAEPIDSITTPKYITLPTPYRYDGAIFLGWYDNPELNGEALTSPYYSTTDCTLYAKWLTEEQMFDQATEMQINTNYAVNITVGGQKGYFVFTAPTSGYYGFYSTNNEFDTYGHLYDSDRNQIEGDDDDGEGNNFLISKYMEAGETCYLVARALSDSNTGSFDVAVGIQITYTFETNGGDYVSDIASGGAITLPTTSKYQAIFAGWYDNPELNGEALTSPYYSTTDCTLYAKWLTEEQLFDQATIMQLNTNYTVNITAYGQKGYFVFTAPTSGYYAFWSSNNDIDTYGHLYNSALEEILSNDDDGGDGNFLISKYMEAGETCYLVARGYDSSYTGSFDVMVGIQITYTFETNGGDYIESIASDEAITLPTTSKYQAIFAGWYDNPDCTGNALASPYTATESCTLYAKWFTTKEECDANATVVEETDRTYPTNITFGSQRVLYSFTPDQNATYSIWLSGDYGAYCEVYNSNLYRVYGSTDEEEDFKAFVYLSAGETYYFVVRYYDGDKTGSFDVIVESPYTYTFNAMGGYVDTESITSAAEIELPTPSKNGAIFLGWYDNADYEGDAIWHNYRATSDCTLYAKWITTEECADQATTITLGNTYPANITAGGQRLYFAFIPTVSGAYAFSSIAGSDVDPYGYLYDANLNLLDSNDDESDEMDEDPNRNFSIIRYLTAGETYYLVVKMFSATKTGSFDITVNTATLYTFETNGGNSIASIASNKEVYLPTPYKDGSVFLGWYDNAACEGTALTSLFYSATDCTLYAKWVTEEELFDQAAEIELNNSCAVDITFAGERKYYVFTPTESGTYTFYSTGDILDTHGHLYDSNKNQLCDDDDGAGYPNFSITWDLTAGETYYWVARLHSEYSIGTFTVILTKN